jgi:hypothetical protein
MSIIKKITYKTLQYSIHHYLISYEANYDRMANTDTYGI